MNENKRPISILILACLFLALGTIGFIRHFREFSQPDGIGIAITEIVAILAGAFMLQGKNWARWLALAWMAFHIILSAFGALRDLAVHTLIFAGLAWLLFRSDARRYFRGAEVP